jgi:enamine deaminase RidA (YjgF/YER057c/UK114 family)
MREGLRAAPLLSEQANQMRALNPPSIAAPFGNYAHGVIRGQVCVTSGQLGLADNGTVLSSVEAQAAICFENIRLILAEADLSFADVLRFSAYVTRREDMRSYMAVRDHVLADLPVKPASTLMIVSGFTRPEFLVEIEALAHA